MIKQLIGKQIVLVLAVVFVAYHVFATVTGIASYADTFWGSNKPVQAMDTESGEHARATAAQALTGQTGIQLGLYTPSEKWPSRIIIANQAMDLQLDGSLESQGSWNVSEVGGNFATNTAIPSEVGGNSVVFGHDRPGLFRNIHYLKAGDTVTIETDSQRFVYTYASAKVVRPTDVSVMDQTTAPILTLITCDGWLSQDRYVVTATLTNVSAL